MLPSLVICVEHCETHVDYFVWLFKLAFFNFANHRVCSIPAMQTIFDMTRGTFFLWRPSLTWPKFHMTAKTYTSSACIVDSTVRHTSRLSSYAFSYAKMLHSCVTVNFHFLALGSKSHMRRRPSHRFSPLMMLLSEILYLITQLEKPRRVATRCGMFVLDLVCIQICVREYFQFYLDW